MSVRDPKNMSLKERKNMERREKLLENVLKRGQYDYDKCTWTAPNDMTIEEEEVVGDLYGCKIEKGIYDIRYISV